MDINNIIKNMEHEAIYLDICTALKQIIEETAEPLEGNCMYRHNSLDPWGCLLNKRINYQKIARGKNRICEIGFNAGHSLLTMLLVNPNAEYVLFDLGSHKYSKPCFEYLKSRFIKTNISIIWGDSRTTLPKYYLSNPKALFDVINIDGGHSYEVYSRDWKYSLSLVPYGGILVFDDTDNKNINAFIEEQINKGVVKEAGGYLKTFGYEHRILIKI